VDWRRLALWLLFAAVVAAGVVLIGRVAILAFQPHGQSSADMRYTPPSSAPLPS
jgi:hypothetical protein